MRRKSLFAITHSLMVLTALLFAIGVRSKEQTPKGPTQPKQFEETRFPIADYATPDPPDPRERSRQLTRGKKYDNSTWGIHPNAVSDSTVRVDYVDRSLPALPFERSSAVVVGQITNAQAFLSNNKTSVYSLFTLQVNEVLKNSTRLSLSSSSIIEVEREGGRVRFPNGRLHMYMIAEYGMPKVGLRYVLFLNNEDAGFQILTGYELREGKVHCLDGLPNLQAYENSDELEFLSQLRIRK